MVFTAALGAVSHLVNDKIDQVVMKALDLLQVIMENPHSPSNKHDFNSYMDNSINGLLLKIGSHNPRVCQKAKNAFLDMAACHYVTAQVCGQALMRNFVNKKTSSTKHMIART